MEEKKTTNRGRYSTLNEVLEYVDACNGTATVKMVSDKFGLKDSAACSLMCYYVKIGYIKVLIRLHTGKRPKNVFTITEKGANRLTRYLNGRAGRTT